MCCLRLNLAHIYMANGMDTSRMMQPLALRALERLDFLVIFFLFDYIVYTMNGYQNISAGSQHDFDTSMGPVYDSLNIAHPGWQYPQNRIYQSGGLEQNPRGM